ncbi:hypothetical protein KPH14_001474 [Odynerus spinipes]|uniref:Uncharacterized protein n=1 Tax=Odynerus spinipes TaxID=1348599 RepID=A0AAD9VTC2_9HYME|nr:hypothetical protein KPH14_001474 [Odynerus spinipes]
MTDDVPEINTIGNVCLRQKGHRNASVSDSTSSSSSNSWSSYVFVASEETAVVPQWEIVTQNDLTESVKVNSVSQKYCGINCNNAWYWKLKRGVLKSLRNKIYPIVTVG